MRCGDFEILWKFHCWFDVLKSYKKNTVDMFAKRVVSVLNIQFHQRQ